MSSAVQADFISLVLQSEGTGQPVVATSEEDFVEEAKDCTKDAHGVSPLLFYLRIGDLEGKTGSAARKIMLPLDVRPLKTSLSPPENSSFNIAGPLATEVVML
jgi:hypothetical protein